jgi:periplasmic copper chaperone A
MIRSYASTFAIIVSLLELLIPAVAVTAEYNVGSIAIMNPWSRATPKGSQTAIGYMTITNNGTASDRLIGGSIEIADMFQLHAMTIENDIAKMRDLRDIEIKPGETVEFKPGGSHVMFVNLKRPLSKGDRVHGTLIFERAGTVSIEYAVEAIGAQRGPQSTGHTSH